MTANEKLDVIISIAESPFITEAQRQVVIFISEHLN
jgi:hypothetical protein